jgi:hypothetical protein
MLQKEKRMTETPFKVSAAKRLIGAVQKKGLKVKSITASPDGTLTISVAPSDEINLDLSRDIDDIVEKD